MEGRGIDIPPRDKRDYHRANKIAVMNYWVYFNQNPVVDNADLLVMDDAHLAEHCLHSLWSVEIDRPKHNNLFKALITELVNRFPEYTVLHDALDENPSPTTPPELLSFIDQVGIASRLEEIVDLQMEIDLTMELRGIITIFEGKNGFPDNFAVYQLFHPFKYYSTLKEERKLDVSQITCCYVLRKRKRGISVLRLYNYTFKDEDDMMSITLLKNAQYNLMKR